MRFVDCLSTAWSISLKTQRIFCCWYPKFGWNNSTCQRQKITGRKTTDKICEYLNFCWFMSPCHCVLSLILLNVFILSPHVGTWVWLKIRHPRPQTPLIYRCIIIFPFSDQPKSRNSLADSPVFAHSKLNPRFDWFQPPEWRKSMEIPFFPWLNPIFYGTLQPFLVSKSPPPWFVKFRTEVPRWFLARLPPAVAASSHHQWSPAPAPAHGDACCCGPTKISGLITKLDF